MATRRTTERSAHSAFGSNEDWDLFYDGALANVFLLSLRENCENWQNGVLSALGVSCAARINIGDKHGRACVHCVCVSAFYSLSLAKCARVWLMRVYRFSFSYLANVQERDSEREKVCVHAIERWQYCRCQRKTHFVWLYYDECGQSMWWIARAREGENVTKMKRKNEVAWVARNMYLSIYSRLIFQLCSVSHRWNRTIFIFSSHLIASPNGIWYCSAYAILSILLNLFQSHNVANRTSVYFYHFHRVLRTGKLFRSSQNRRIVINCIPIICTSTICVRLRVMWNQLTFCGKTPRSSHSDLHKLCKIHFTFAWDSVRIDDVEIYSKIVLPIIVFAGRDIKQYACSSRILCYATAKYIDYRMCRKKETNADTVNVLCELIRRCAVGWFQIETSKRNQRTISCAKKG